MSTSSPSDARGRRRERDRPRSGMHLKRTDGLRDQMLGKVSDRDARLGTESLKALIDMVRNLKIKTLGQF